MLPNAFKKELITVFSWLKGSLLPCQPTLSVSSAFRAHILLRLEIPMQVEPCAELTEIRQVEL
jgi:hypothetical protein